uniref:Uncharacterized protein n=1 Tax=Varanus komodoensis TaxID=61221 RepID=A0A8D2J7F8_VARKO
FYFCPLICSEKAREQPWLLTCTGLELGFGLGQAAASCERPQLCKLHPQRSCRCGSGARGEEGQRNAQQGEVGGNPLASITAGSSPVRLYK